MNDPWWPARVKLLVAVAAGFLFVIDLVGCTPRPQTGLDPAFQHTEWKRGLEAAIHADAAGDAGEAERQFRRSAAVVEPSEPGDVRLGVSLIPLADFYVKRDRTLEATPIFERAVEILERDLGPRHPMVTVGVLGLAICDLASLRFDEAAQRFDRALLMLETSVDRGPRHPLVAVALVGLARTDVARHEFDRAADRLDRALAIVEETRDTEFRAGLQSLHEEVARLTSAPGLWAGMQFDRLLRRRYIPDPGCLDGPSRLAIGSVAVTSSGVPLVARGLCR